MNQWNYSNARAQLTMIMDQAIVKHPVEITAEVGSLLLLLAKHLMKLTRKPNMMLLTIKFQHQKKIQKFKLSPKTLFTHAARFHEAQYFFNSTWFLVCIYLCISI